MYGTVSLSARRMTHFDIFRHTHFQNVVSAFECTNTYNHTPYDYILSYNMFVRIAKLKVCDPDGTN